MNVLFCRDCVSLALKRTYGGQLSVYCIKAARATLHPNKGIFKLKNRFKVTSFCPFIDTRKIHYQVASNSITEVMGSNPFEPT